MARRATKSSASSRLSMPATQAATYSPRLCPITAPGFKPQDRHNCASAYSRANNAVCVYWVSSSSPSEPSHMTGRRGRGNSASASEAHRSSAWRNTGWVSYNCFPMPGYWVPWPENRKASLGSWVEMRLGTVFANCWRAWGAFFAVTARRKGKCERPALAVKATSGKGSSGWASRWAS